MLQGIEVLCHNAIRIQKEKIIYIDPFKIKQNYNDADIIFITHSHYDHFSPEDIEKVKKDETVIVVTKDLFYKSMEVGFNENNIILVEPNQKHEIENIVFYTVPAYNKVKHFHPRENNWVGYILEINGKKYYIAGDTDMNEEIQNVKCDVAFTPVGGTYTMDADEAAKLISLIKPKIAVPVHYGTIVGSKMDAEKFSSLLPLNIKCEMLIKN